MPAWPNTPPATGDEQGGYARNACLERLNTTDLPSHVVVIAEASWYERIEKGDEPDPTYDFAKFTVQDAINAPDDVLLPRTRRRVGICVSFARSASGEPAATSAGATMRSSMDTRDRLGRRSSTFRTRTTLVEATRPDERGAEDRLRFATFPFGSRIAGTRYPFH